MISQKVKIGVIASDLHAMRVREAGGSEAISFNVSSWIYEIAEPVPSGVRNLFFSEFCP